LSQVEFPRWTKSGRRVLQNDSPAVVSKTDGTTLHTASPSLGVGKGVKPKKEIHLCRNGLWAMVAQVSGTFGSVGSFIA